MIYFIVGGSKSGKSFYGEKEAIKLCKNSELYYIATMNPYDKEDEKRIETHRRQRDGLGFKTIEQYRDIEEILLKVNYSSTIFIDSITSLLTNEMFLENEIIEKPSRKIIDGIKKVVESASNVVIISDYIFSDSIIYDKYTEEFKKELGYINIKIANMADKVVECFFGNVYVHKDIEENK
ncbi:putative Cobalbumin biosynthesis protein [Clostridium bornimense]|uniref:Adenosylcobinamide kinase n=1 Tax=Clostridium bornimense TaxID=1216932 RepID=W6RXF4_9CLOT|nr:bifunctional adenosylcobinamide kinase/adenosylcobinamide-phosphate guanylyltransferase [Clostridium bornimense]CDM68314.1 putative Cobalbumin biosynthesis protein [Clostridium bornimense]